MINKKILSQIDLYYGSIDMPEFFEIDRENIFHNILKHQTKNLKGVPFTREWDKIVTYIKEFAQLKHNLIIVEKDVLSDVYFPGQQSESLLQINPVDLKHSPDYVMLYGVNVAKDSCSVYIEYDDNRRKGRSWVIPLNNNDFVMFPSTQRYHITKNTSQQLNSILTVTYELG